MNKKIIVVCIIAIIILIIGIIIISNNKKKKGNVMSTNAYVSNITNISNQTGNDISTNIEKINHDTEKVTIEIEDATITPESVSIIITDNNENHYGWGTPFKIQEKIQNEWKDLDYVSNDLGWVDITYSLDQNNQIKEKLNIEKYYGKLNSGIYRVVKTVYDNEYIDIYSNEFKIE